MNSKTFQARFEALFPLRNAKVQTDVVATAGTKFGTRSRPCGMPRVIHGFNPTLPQKLLSWSPAVIALLEAMYRFTCTKKRLASISVIFLCSFLVLLSFRVHPFLYLPHSQ
jgi:hypothetical protein